MQLFFSAMFLGMALLVGNLSAEPNQPQQVAKVPTKRNCKCVDCKCTPERHCGCYSTEGCKCSGQRTCSINSESETDTKK